MIHALLGGVLIGASVSLAWSGARQVAGISGIVGDLLRGESPRRTFCIWFLSGLLLTSVAIAFTAPPSTTLAARPLGWVVSAGLLVGFGTQLGSGCTSGHGVCGVSRGSPRSLVATLVFIVSGAGMVFLTRHALGGAP